MNHQHPSNGNGANPNANILGRPQLPIPNSAAALTEQQRQTLLHAQMMAQSNMNGLLNSAFRNGQENVCILQTVILCGTNPNGPIDRIRQVPNDQQRPEATTGSRASDSDGSNNSNVHAGIGSHAANISTTPTITDKSHTKTSSLTNPGIAQTADTSSASRALTQGSGTEASKAKGTEPTVPSRRVAASAGVPEVIDVDEWVASTKLSEENNMPRPNANVQNELRHVHTSPETVQPGSSCSSLLGSDRTKKEIRRVRNEASSTPKMRSNFKATASPLSKINGNSNTNSPNPNNSSQTEFVIVGLSLQQFREELEQLEQEVKTYELIEIPYTDGPKETGESYLSIYVCKYEGCPYTNRASRVAEHILVKHLGREPMCPVCEKLLPGIEPLRRHRDFDDKDEKGTCLICSVCRRMHSSGKKRSYYEAKCTGRCVLDGRAYSKSEPVA